MLTQRERADRAQRTVATIRAGWGALLMSAPEPVLRAAGRPEARGVPIAVLRVLGVRHLAQAALSGLCPGRSAALVGSAADALHALSAVVLALASSRWRRAALSDAAVATCLAVAGWRLGRTQAGEPDRT